MVRGGRYMEFLLSPLPEEYETKPLTLGILAVLADWMLFGARKLVYVGCGRGDIRAGHDCGFQGVRCCCTSFYSK